jgi:hypothetical protein
MALMVLGVLFTVLPHAQAAVLAVAVVLGVGVKAGVTLLESRLDVKIAADSRAAGGVDSKEQIGELLDELGDEHVIVPHVPSPCGSVEEVIISKNHGIFLVEPKPQHGRVEVIHSRIRINGRLPETDFILQALRNNCWLADELAGRLGLQARVNSLVVFTNAFVVTSRSVMGVTVTNRDFLLASIQRLGKPLPADVWEAREQIASHLCGEAAFPKDV